MKLIIQFIVALVRVLYHDLFIFVNHLLLEIVCILGIITVTRERIPNCQAEERGLIVFCSRRNFKTMERILIVEDSELATELIVDHLKSMGQENFKFAKDVRGAMDIFNHFNPGLIICDIHLEGEKNGIDFIKSVAEQKTNIAVVYISSDMDDNILFTAQATHPHSFLTKPFTKEQLVTAVKMALLKRNQNDPGKYQITSREIDVLRLISKGFNNHEIGDQLFISHHTVDSRRRRILEKLNVTNINQALYIAADKGWI